MYIGVIAAPTLIRDPGPRDEQSLAALCARLVGERDGDAETRRAILRGEDPLGDWFCRLRSPETRRADGATYTPAAVVETMIAWARSAGQPARVVDPGCGSGRFLVAAGRAFPEAQLVGIETDPLAAQMARANLAVLGLGERAEIRLGDYREVDLGRVDGASLFVGNPPYVRHHEIGPAWKRWLTETAARRGFRASQLAGLHVHFMLATLEHARPGDLGAFITASEWLDTNYGQLVRDLLAGPLGVERLDLIDPKVAPFADALTTGVISYFRVGSARAGVSVRRVRGLRARATSDEYVVDREVGRESVRSSTRWSSLGRRRARASGMVELGELCRVHRGQVTGANAVWIAGGDTPPLPERVLRPAITRARELIAAGEALLAAAGLRRVIDLPADLDALDRGDRALIEAFLDWARAAGADRSYVARHRRPWWAVKLRAPAPILATYMARRPPAFVRNLAEARHINIAHGIYPREPMSDESLDALAGYLARSVSTDDGRTYAGGLTKFEPKEMERLLIPKPGTGSPV